MSFEEFSNDLNELKLPKFRGNQIYKWIQKGIASFDEMTNIPKDLRGKLNDRYTILGCEIEIKRCSQIDETVKYLFKLHDGNFIESVLMKYKWNTHVYIS